MAIGTYTKLNSGEWGIRVDGEVGAGVTVEVVTKAGKSKTERVKRVIWSGADSRTGRTITLCAIEQRRRPDSGPGSTSYRQAKRVYEQTDDYYGSGMYDEES